jgi:hypothetical protein
MPKKTVMFPTITTKESPFWRKTPCRKTQIKFKTTAINKIWVSIPDLVLPNLTKLKAKNRVRTWGKSKIKRSLFFWNWRNSKTLPKKEKTPKIYLSYPCLTANSMTPR